LKVTPGGTCTYQSTVKGEVQLTRLPNDKLQIAFIDMLFFQIFVKNPPLFQRQLGENIPKTQPYLVVKLILVTRETYPI
jgi:hypothetical protein